MSTQQLQIDYSTALKNRRKKIGKEQKLPKGKLTQIRAAKDIGISLEQLRKIEQGYNQFNPRTKEKLDRWLGVRK